MAAPWKCFQSFFLLAAKFICAPGAIKAEQNTSPIRRNIPQLKLQNIRESNLDFTAHFGEINSDMLYLCRRSLSGPQRAVFAFSPLFGESRWKKTLNLRFFAKKQVNFWVVYLLRRKLLIINENMMMYWEVGCLPLLFLRASIDRFLR